MSDPPPTHNGAPPERDRRVLLGALLLGLVLAQSIITLRGTIVPMYLDARDVRGLPALQRSAIIAFGDTFAAYIGFLRSQIPETGRVVIPPFDTELVYGNVGLMQFFLFPREVVNCPSGPDLPACTRSITSPGTYLLRVGGFPDPTSVAPGRQLWAFSEHLGVFAVSGQANSQAVTPPPAIWQTAMAESSSMPALVRLVVGGVALGIFFVAGAWIAGTLTRAANTWRFAGLSFPLGFGTFTWLLFLGSLVHLSLPATVVLVMLLLALPGLVRFGARRGEGSSPDVHIPTAADYVALAILGLGVVSLAALSVGLAYSEWDAMAFWSIKGYGMAWNKDVLAAPLWGAPGQDHPISMPIGIAVVQLLQGDTEPITKVINPLFFASLTLGSYQFWRIRGAPGSLALACTLALATVPLLTEHATNGYANLPAACYLTLGTITYVQGALEQNKRVQWLGGWILALATWTRSDSLPMLLAMAPALYLALRAGRNARPCASCLFAPILLIGGSWLVSAPRYVSGGYATTAFRHMLGGIGRGEWDLAPLHQAIRSLGGDLLEPAVWGLLLPAGLALALLAAANLKIADRDAGIPILSSALAAALMMLAMFYTLASQGEAQLWIDTGLARLFLPSVALGWVGIVTLAIGQPGPVARERRWGPSAPSSVHGRGAEAHP